MRREEGEEGENDGLRVGDENEEGGYEGRRHLYTKVTVDHRQLFLAPARFGGLPGGDLEGEKKKR